jgi:hypothetical protein
MRQDNVFSRLAKSGPSGLSPDLKGDPIFAQDISEIAALFAEGMSLIGATDSFMQIIPLQVHPSSHRLLDQRPLRQVFQKGKCVFSKQHSGLFQISPLQRIHNRLVNLG